MEQNYYGSDLDRKQCELKGMRIDPEHRRDESRLVGTRWFDYRFMHPVAATYLYADLYRRQTEEFYETFVDARTVEDARAFTPEDVFMSRDLTSMWLARASADALGLPYGFVIRFAQERFFSRAQHKFPRPNQLYGEEFEIDLKAAWEERLARQITYSQAPYFSAGQWRGEPAQVEHVKFVIGQIMKRPSPRHFLLARMFSEGVLTESMASSFMADSEVKRAVSYCAQFHVSQC